MTQQDSAEPADAGCGPDTERPHGALGPEEEPPYEEVPVDDQGPVEVQA